MNSKYKSRKKNRMCIIHSNLLKGKIHSKRESENCQNTIQNYVTQCLGILKSAKESYRILTGVKMQRNHPGIAYIITKTHSYAPLY